jgi:hypothetical protein
LDDYRLDAPPERWVPLFTRPTYLSQEAIEVKFGALVTPVGVDWDGDGDEDLVCGNTAGYVGVIHNLGDFPPRWSSPSLALVETQFSNHAGLVEDIRHRAGPNGSIQGPCEANWGYTTLSVADWDHDGLVDLIVNDIRGKAVWYRNDGARVKPRFSHNHPVHVDHSGPPPKPDWMWWTPKDNELVTQWRTTPVVVDWNDDGLNDLVMLDPEGYLAFYERARDKGQGTKDKAAALDAQPSSLDAHPLLPPQRLFCIEGPCEFDQRHRPVGDKRDGLLRLNANRAGASGRRKLCIVDWDGDGRRDLLVNSVNVNFLRNVRTDDEGRTWFRDEGPLDDRVLAGHDTSPTTVDWDKNGIPDLLVGAEDGHLYYKRNPRAARD